MPLYGSRNILAKDIIGWAEELAAVEEARLTLASLGRTFYNMSIAEIHNVLGYIDVEALLQKMSVTLGSAVSGKYYSFSLLTGGEAAITSGTLVVGKRYRMNDWKTADDFTNVGAPSNADGVEFVALGTTPTAWAAGSVLQALPLYNYDKIVAFEMTNALTTNLVQVQCFALPITEFLRHKSFVTAGVPSGAGHPYEESAVYSLQDYNLHVLFGNTITPTSPTATIYYTRQPTILNKENFDSAYMEVPDKYAPLLASRIAAYAEMRQGITDKSMAVVQNSYNQMLAPVDAQLRAKIMDSFQFKPTFTPSEQPMTNNMMVR